MIAPLGSDYVELLAVVDEPVGSETVLGGPCSSSRPPATGGSRSVSPTTTSRPPPPGSGSRAARLPDPSRRQEVRWRGAGIEERGEDLWLPFFISWDVPPELHPGAAPAGHRVDAVGIAWVEVGGDEGRLRDWLGGADAPIRVVDARSASARRRASAPWRRRDRPG